MLAETPLAEGRAERSSAVDRALVAMRIVGCGDFALDETSKVLFLNGIAETFSRTRNGFMAMDRASDVQLRAIMGQTNGESFEMLGLLAAFQNIVNSEPVRLANQNIVLAVWVPAIFAVAFILWLPVVGAGLAALKKSAWCTLTVTLSALAASFSWGALSQFAFALLKYNKLLLSEHAQAGILSKLWVLIFTSAAIAPVSSLCGPPVFIACICGWINSPRVIFVYILCSLTFDYIWLVLLGFNIFA